MDLHALPRRDLQALCKRNGVRANMTNAAMADALGALPTVDGIEEYVKQPAAVPEPAGKAAVAEEEQRREKQGSPLPRGRRVAAKSAEPVEPEEGKSKEEEKEDAKQESNKEDDAPAWGGMGRRGAGRRARPAPVVATSAVERAEPVKQIEDKGKREEEEDAPALGVGRRGASRRARHAPAVSTSAAEPVVKAATDAEEEERPLPRAGRVTVKASQPTRPDGDVEDAEENLKREVNNEDASAQGAVRRGPSRRARPAPVAATSAPEPAAKAASVEEKQAGQLPRDRRVTVKSPEPARPDDVVEEEKDDLKRVANNVDAPRCGSHRRARPAPFASKPAAKAASEEELRSPPPRGRRVTVKSRVPITAEDGAEGDKEDMQVEASKENVTTLGGGRRGASRRARAEPAVSAPAVEVAAEEDVPAPRGRCVNVKAPEPVRPDDGEEEDNEDLKLEEKVDDAPALGVGRRGASRRARPALVEAPATRSGPTASTAEEGIVAVDAVPTRPTRQRKPTMKASAAEKVPRRATKRAVVRNSTMQHETEQEEPQGAISVAEVVPAPVSDKGCDDLENVAEVAGPQNKEQNKVVNEPEQEDEEVVMNEGCDDPESMEEAAGPQNEEQHDVIDEPKEDEEVVMSEDEVQMEETAAEEPLVNDQACADKSPLEVQQVDGEYFAAPLPCQDDSPILGLVSKEAGQAVEEDGASDTEGLLEEAGEEIRHAGEEIEMLPVIQALQVPPLADESAEEVCFTGHVDHGSVMESSNEALLGTEENSEVDAEDGLVSQENEDEPTETVDETILLDCSGYISPVTEEKEKAVETMVSQPTQIEVVTSDNMSQVTVIDGEVVDMEKAELFTESSEEVCFTGHVDHGSVMESSNEALLGTEEIIEVDAEDGLVCQEKEDEPTETVDETILLDCSGYISPEDEEKAVETMVSQPAQNEVVTSDTMSQVTVIDGEVVDMEKAELVTETVDETILGCAGYISPVTEEKEKAVETMVSQPAQNEVVSSDNMSQVTVIDGEVVDIEKAELVTENLPQSTSIMDEGVEDDGLQTDFVHVDEPKVVVDLNKAEMVIDELPQSTATIDEDVEEDDFEFDFVHVDEEKQVVDTEKAELVTEELLQSTGTIDETVKEDDFQTDLVLVDEQEEVATSDEVPEVIMTDGKIVEQEMVLITEETQQGTATMDAEDVGDRFETDFVLADTQKEVVTADKVPDFTGTDGEVDVEEEADDTTEEMPHATASGHIASALLDDVIKSLSKFTITEPMLSRDEDMSICKHSSEKNIAEPVCKSSSERNIAEPCKNSTEKTAGPVCSNSNENNTAGLVPMQEKKRVKVSKKSKDFSNLSLGQLKVTLKKTLQRKESKESKRVVLARLDENVCRSDEIGQQQQG